MKKVIAIALMAIMVLSLAACGNKAASSDAGTKSEAAIDAKAESKTNAQPEAKGTDHVGEPLVVYSNSASDGRGDWLVERAAKEGFNLQYISAGAADIQNRLLGEKNSPIADVAYGLNPLIWESLKAQDILVKYVPGWAGEIAEGLNDPEGYYHAIVKQACLLAYDLNQISEEDAPKDWLDLWNNEKYYGTYETQFKLTAGTTRNVLTGVLTRYLDPNGDLGISDEGWKQIELYYEHGVLAQDGVDLYADIADPTTSVICGQMWSSGVATRDDQYGTKTGFAIPEVGVPYAVEGVAIIQGTKHIEEAQRFVEWFGSAEIQGEWAQQFSTLPANTKAVDKADEFNQFIGTMKAQDIDWKLVAENIDAWCEKIELQYMP